MQYSRVQTMAHICDESGPSATEGIILKRFISPIEKIVLF